jgi:hypothetical protein
MTRVPFRSILTAAGLALFSLLPARPGGRGQDGDLAPILDRAAARAAAYVPLESWRASVKSVQTKVDKNWKPEKVTTVSRVVTVRRDDYDERILKAEEVEDGRTKDVTAKYAEDSRERLEKRRRREAERKARGEAGPDDEGVRGMTLKEFLPFEAGRRADFTFRRLPDEAVDGRSALVLEVKARVPDEKNWEGAYYLASDNFDILKLVLRPSRNPKFVKELEMEMVLDVLPGDHLVLRSSRVRVNGGIFIKHIRMISEDEYSDYRVPAPDDHNSETSEVKS